MAHGSEEVLCDQDQAASYLTVSTHFLAADRQRKREIPFIKIGRLVRYRKSDLDTYLEKQTVGGATV